MTASSLTGMSELTDRGKASGDFDWSEISPTIFGAVFESTGSTASEIVKQYKLKFKKKRQPFLWYKAAFYLGIQPNASGMSFGRIISE